MLYKNKLKTETNRQHFVDGLIQCRLIQSRQVRNECSLYSWMPLYTYIYSNRLSETM